MAISANSKILASDITTALSNKQNALGFTPVQQGGGIGQGTNKVYLGWSGSGLKVTVDQTDIGTLVRSVNGTTADANGNVTIASGGGMTNRQVFTASGTFTAPKTGTYTFMLVTGGKNGNGGTGWETGAGGGGDSGWVNWYTLYLTANTSVTCTVGANNRGLSSITENGITHSNNSTGSYIAYGGGGGDGAYGSVGETNVMWGGAGGSGGAKSSQYGGGGGGAGGIVISGITSPTAGSGGNGGKGKGGTGGTGFGAGGGGGGTNASNTNTSGGTGTSGVIVVYW